MKKLVIFLSVMTALVLSKATIDDTATLFKNTLKKWNIEVRDKRDYMERYKRLVEMKRRVDDTTTGVILDTLNRFSVNNDQEHEMFAEMTKRSVNLTEMAATINEEEEKGAGVAEILKRSSVKSNTTFDFWENVVGFNMPRNQASCGACWIFPALATMEVVYKFHTREHVNFSPGYFMDCTYSYSGCAGGDVREAYTTTKNRQYLMYEKDWPYTADYIPCKFTDDINAMRNNAFKKMWLQEFHPTSISESGFIERLHISPVAFAMTISMNYYGYSGGIYRETSGTMPHGQLLVGYTPEYLRVRNSYGWRWGDGGYINFIRGSASYSFFKHGFYIVMHKRREMQYEFCSNAKVVNRTTCKESCEAMNKEGETGWTLAVIPTQQHNHLLAAMASVRWPGVKSDDKFNYLFIGLLGGKKGIGNDGPRWVDEHTYLNYVNFISHTHLDKLWSGSFGLIHKEWATWIMKGNPKFEARGFCSRPRTCWDFSSNIRNAQVVYSHEDTTNLVEGTTAQVTCKESCKMKGESFSKCQAGLWSGSIEPKVTCSCPEDIDWEEKHEDNKEENKNRADEKREMQYEFCSNAKPVNRTTCKESCEAMNKEGETGWGLAIIPTVQHNNKLLKMANDRWPGVQSDDKYNYLFIGLLGLKGTGTELPGWEDKHTQLNYVNVSLQTHLKGVFGLINKNSGRWVTKGNPKFEARGFCSRPRTCWDFSSNLPNAQVVYSHEDTTNLVEGTTAQVKCKESCKIKGESFLKCQAGLWSGSIEPKVTCSCPGDNDREENKDENKNRAGEKEEDENEEQQKEKETEDENKHEEDEKKEQQKEKDENKEDENKEDENKEVDKEGDKNKEKEGDKKKDKKNKKEKKNKKNKNKKNKIVEVE